jgi:hypothetical protein
MTGGALRKYNPSRLAIVKGATAARFVLFGLS